MGPDAASMPPPPLLSLDEWRSVSFDLWEFYSEYSATPLKKGEKALGPDALRAIDDYIEACELVEKMTRTETES